MSLNNLYSQDVKLIYTVFMNCIVYATILISHYVSCQTFGQKMGQLAVNFGELSKGWFKNFVDFKGSKVPITILSDYQNDRKEFPAEDEVFFW
jgi:hypothetical protein